MNFRKSIFFGLRHTCPFFVSARRSNGNTHGPLESPLRRRDERHRLPPNLVRQAGLTGSSHDGSPAAESDPLRLPCRQQAAACWESHGMSSDARKNKDQGSTDDPRKGNVERPKGQGLTAAPSRSASSPPGRGNPAALTFERGEGEPDCRKAVLRGDAEQLELAHATSVAGQGGGELSRRTSSGAQATLVPELWQRNASSMSSHGRAWRIRIGNSVNSRQREGPCRCGFLFFTRFYEGALGGERSLSIFAPRLTSVMTKRAL